MILLLQQALLSTLAISAIGLYLLLVFKISTWLWRMLVASIDAFMYRSTKPVTNQFIISMWKAAKETHVIFFAPTIMLWDGLKTAILHYINAVDQLVADRR